MTKQALRQTFLDTLPVLTGYLFLGCGFGILLSQSGYGLGWALAMSLFIYAGSGQYLAVELLTGGAGLITAAIATLLVNARHLFYGISLLDAYRDTGKAKPYLIFSLTDETYSLVTQAQPPEGASRRAYCLLVSFLDQCYWVVGSCLGVLVGTYVPVSFEGVSFVLTALFVTLFVEQWLSRKERFPALVGVLSSLVCLLIFGKDIFLIPSMVLMALLLTLNPKAKRRNTP